MKSNVEKVSRHEKIHTPRVALILASKPGGSETFLREKIKGLNKSQQVKVFVFPDNYFKGNGWFLLIPYSILALFSLKRILKFISLHRKGTFRNKLVQVIVNLPLLTSFRKYDFVHYSFANLICGRPHLGKAIGARTSVSLRGYDVTYYPVNHTGCYDGVWEYVDQIQFNSFDLYEWALFWGAKQETPAFLISAAVNDTFLVTTPPPKPSRDILKIISIGRLHWKKGFDIALFALHDLKKRNIPFVYHVYGNGKEKEKLAFLICSLGLEENTTIKEPVNHEDVPKMLDDADILLAPSLQEGCSNVCLEAQARGTYCIVADAEGMREIIEDGITGDIVPKGNAIALANALEDYYNLNQADRQFRAQMGINRVKNNYLRSDQIKKWVSFYSSLKNKEKR